MLLLLRPAGMCGLATATRRMPNLIRLVIDGVIDRDGAPTGGGRPANER